MNQNTEIRDEYGKYIIVCDSTGIHTMTSADFNEYDVDNQVHYGEQGGSFEIYRVYCYTAEDKLFAILSWEEAQQYFEKEEIAV